MLAKLLVILALFVAVSFGSAPDCKVAPPTKADCCTVMPDYDGKKVGDQCNAELKIEGTSDFTCEQVTCFMKKNNHITSDNKIDKEAFTKYAKMNLTEWSSTIETSLQKCYTKSETAKCAPQTFLFCISVALMKECPTASWLKTEECTTLKSYFDNCPNADVFNM